MAKDKGFTIDKETEFDPISKVCWDCKHLLNYGAGRICEAFPTQDSIPIEIWNGENKHLKPLRIQGNNIVYEKEK